MFYGYGQQNRTSAKLDLFAAKMIGFLILN